jgi:hypothetical protein
MRVRHHLVFLVPKKNAVGVQFTIVRGQLTFDSHTRGIQSTGTVPLAHKVLRKDHVLPI